jgi:50S ribosomal subunit-associated GTPase HflX
MDGAPSGRSTGPGFRLVRQKEVSVGERARSHKSKLQAALDPGKHRTPRAQDKRIHHDLEFVDKARLRKLGDEAPASQDNHVRTRVPL